MSRNDWHSRKVAMPAEAVRTAMPDDTNGEPMRGGFRLMTKESPYTYERVMITLRNLARRMAPPGTTAIYWWHDQLIYELDHGLGDAYPVECCIWWEERHAEAVRIANTPTEPDDAPYEHLR